MSVNKLVRNCVAGNAFVKNVKKYHGEKIVNISEIAVFNYQIIKYLLHRIKKYLFINGYNFVQVAVKITDLCETDAEFTLITLTNFFTDDVVRALYANDAPVTKRKLRRTMRSEATKFLIFDLDQITFKLFFPS